MGLGVMRQAAKAFCRLARLAPLDSFGRVSTPLARSLARIPPEPFVFFFVGAAVVAVVTAVQARALRARTALVGPSPEGVA